MMTTEERHSRNYVPPAVDLAAFNCVYCGTYAVQEWGEGHFFVKGSGRGRIQPFQFCRCVHCSQFSLWANQELKFPLFDHALLPNEDLSPEIQHDFDEAARIVQLSPRGAAALLRLCIQKICIQLGEKGKNINNDISSLVEKGLPAQIQQALDTVRVVGNEAVHPGQIDLKDNQDVAKQLFSLINLIAEVMITQPKQTKAMYECIVPKSKRDAIEKRDKPNRDEDDGDT